jgi:hypothetical protein
MVDLASRPADAVIMQRWLVLPAVLAACGGSGDAASGDASGGDATTVDARGGVGEPAELAGMTLYHNQVRAMVDTAGLAAGPLPPLAWDASLAATAAAWVAQCQDTDGNGLVDHNANRMAGHPWYVGENIFASSGTATAHDAVLYPMYGWAAEQVHFHYDTNTCDAGATCGHYTQVVWRATQQVGCALGRCPGLAYPNTIVCDYGPGGNVNNQKPY